MGVEKLELAGGLVSMVRFGLAWPFCLLLVLNELAEEGIRATLDATLMHGSISGAKPSNISSSVGHSRICPKLC